jgi:hypothetical protein
MDLGWIAYDDLSVAQIKCIQFGYEQKNDEK